MQLNLGVTLDELIRNQFGELRRTFPDLKLSKDQDGHWIVSGSLLFSASYKELEYIEDCFSVQMVLPYDYPNNPPKTFEIGGRVCRRDEYHINKSGDMCLAAPLELKKRFIINPTLLHFVKELVVPFLYAFSYQERFGKRPWGELSHGGKGLLEYYQDVFNTKDLRITLRLLKMLVEGSYRGHLPCPCGSSSKLRHCHGDTLRELIQIQSPEDFYSDSKTILLSLSKAEVDMVSGREIPLRFLREIKDNRIEKE